MAIRSRNIYKPNQEKPFKLSRTPSELTQKPPHKGEHTEEILDELGISSDKLQSLIDKKII